MPSDPRNTPNYSYQIHPQPQPPVFNTSRHGSPRDYQERARGHYRGGQRHYGPPQHMSSPTQPVTPVHYSGRGRPESGRGRSTGRHGLYNPNAVMNYSTAEQQRSMRHVIMKQSDYLTQVGKKAYETHKLSKEEMLAKEDFRRELEDVAREALGSKYPGLNKNEIKLKCYGSLANGFALAGCDMDLLLAVPEYPKAEKTAMAVKDLPGEEDLAVSDNDSDDTSFRVELRRVLEKAYLEKEIGARLLTKTRVPILRVCQKPPPELLQNLRGNQSSWEESQAGAAAPDIKPETVDEPAPAVETVDQALSTLNLADTGRPVPAPRGNSGLEFTGDCGILCDINFTNFVAIHNSALLRLYGSFDPRVHELGLFVKIWAKARDINTPYRGTLSSYGYILMVLHYLMNVARPPVIPNLQYLAKIDDDWNPGRKVELFEGFDVRFVRDSKALEEVRAEMAAARNRESAGQLLRGFFQYYATREGFHWTRDVISIRQKGGILTKQEKGWTEAKWAPNQNKSVRLRYLLAIEDPFEVEHNIARTVGHHGIVNIRDEFRRAWSIIEKIGTDAELPPDEFLEAVTDRVDTLRKDQEFHRLKQMHMKQELEATEKAMLQKADAEGPGPHTDGTSGSSGQNRTKAHSSEICQGPSPNSKLTSPNSPQDKNHRKGSRSWRHRRVEIVDSDDEDEDGKPADDARKSREQQSAPLDPGAAGKELEKRGGGLCSRSEVLLANGFDNWGNPVAWDIETQDGRWLHWRDNKIRRGEMLGPFTNPSLRELDEQCPYDSRRPNPYLGKPYKNTFEKMNYERPPWPSNKYERAISSAPLSCENPPATEKFDVDSKTAVKAEIENVESHSNRPSQPNSPKTSVGNEIPWDESTEAGRWLRYRDKCIRDGSWKHHQHSKFTELSNSFPYNPNMTRAELEEKNQLLRQFDMTTIRRKSRGWKFRNNNPISPGLADFVTEKLDASPNEVPGTAQRAHNHSTCSNSGDFGSSANTIPSFHSEPSHDTDPDLSPSEYPQIPNMDFIRSRRLAFFSSHGTSSMGDAQTKDQVYRQMSAVDFKDVTVEQFQRPIQHFQPPGQPQPDTGSIQKNPALKEVAPESPDPRVHGSANEPSRNLASEEKDAATVPPSIQVPRTLYPHLDNNRRPRDEDPNIMPIPRNLGFQFDRRQLRDLAVIAKGGNGCAREGEEFNIESNYEWGGGGMMGWRTSTGPQYAGADGGQTLYEFGRGDEDDLLNELPGDVD